MDRARPDGLRIAERSPRLVGAFLGGSLVLVGAVGVVGLVTHSTDAGHGPGAWLWPAALVVAGAVGVVRGWRIALVLDDRGLTVRNLLRTQRLAWSEVARFADGFVRGGEVGNIWTLRIVTLDGRVVTAAGTGSGRRDARPQTLSTLADVASRRGVTVSFAGYASADGNPANPGWYPDPAGSPGERYWDGTRWSATLRSVVEQGAPGAAANRAERWRPLPGANVIIEDLAAEAHRARVRARSFFVLGAGLALCSLALFLHTDQMRHGDFTASSLVFSAALLSLVAAWTARDNRKRIDGEIGAAATAAESDA